MSEKIFDSVEGLIVANMNTMADIRAAWLDMYYKSNKEDERNQTADDYAAKSNLGGDQLNEDIMKYILSDLPYPNWTMPMVVLHAELRMLYQQNDLLSTILEQNKPSLLTGDSDDDNHS